VKEAKRVRCRSEAAHSTGNGAYVLRALLQLDLPKFDGPASRDRYARGFEWMMLAGWGIRREVGCRHPSSVCGARVALGFARDLRASIARDPVEY